MDQVGWARGLAEALLAEPLPRRWAHTQGVGHKAESIADAFGEDGGLLVAAAWLHDIGYSPDAAVIGFHPLDGARYLRDKCGASPQLCSLVAYHSCAEIEARHRGLDEALSGEFVPVVGILADALTYCDMTTTPDGGSVDVEGRLAEVRARYGEDHPVALSMREAELRILDGARAVRAQLSAS